ncbi:MAG: hypothetical protein ACRD0A_20830 [Acidimicrobiales bacterium]
MLTDEELAAQKAKILGS